MAISAREKLTVLENILARVGLNESTLQEYHKAVSGLRGMQSFMETQPPPMPMQQGQQPMQPQGQPPMQGQPGTPPMV